MKTKAIQSRYEWLRQVLAGAALGIGAAAVMVSSIARADESEARKLAAWSHVASAMVDTDGVLAETELALADLVRSQRVTVQSSTTKPAVGLLSALADRKARR